VIHRLIDKIRVGPPPTENADRYRQGATVMIRTLDGRSVSNTVFQPKGSAALGIDWVDIEAKYRALMPNSGLNPERIEQSLALVRDFVNAPSVVPLVGLLRP
jgi:2-methylcitrate dehydratase PrpD